MVITAVSLVSAGLTLNVYQKTFNENKELKRVIAEQHSVIKDLQLNSLPLPNGFALVRIVPTTKIQPMNGKDESRLDYPPIDKFQLWDKNKYDLNSSYYAFTLR